MNIRTAPRYLAILLSASILAGTLHRMAGQAVTKPGSRAGAEPEQVHDPLGRSTPQGTVLGFLQTAQSDKFKEAAEYLQLSKRERATEGEQLARELHVLLDSALVGRVGTISNQPNGSVQIGIPEDHERIGIFRVNGTETPVDLVHVSNPGGGEIWLFSSEVLARVPDLFRQMEGNDMEPELPGFLVSNQLFSTPLWRVIAFLLLIPVSFGLGWAMTRLLRAAVRAWSKQHHRSGLESVYDSLTAPVTLILTVLLHQVGIHFLGVPLLIRVYYQRAVWLIVVAGLAWLVFPLINVWGERARRRTLAGAAGHSDTIVFLAQRILKVAVVVIATLVMLSMLGINMAAAVAGLGIGSIAIAFAAQKTLENLLGGVSILSDQVIRVGELCRVGEDTGTVEDISLRSTRIRTLNRTELSVPNGKLANMTVENLTRGDKSLFRTKISLRYETSSAQLRWLLTETQNLLHNDSRVEAESARVRFVGFGETGLDIEINCHILTRAFAEFLAIREELLLRIMDIVAGAGIRFAFPSRVLYAGREEVSVKPQNHGADEMAHAARKKAG